MKQMISSIALATVLLLMGSAANAGDAKEAYDKNCASCHGKDGTGNTPAGKKLKVKDYTDAKVQSEMKDEDMSKAIKEGVKEGDKTKMKGYADKLSDDQVKDLVAYIRAFKK